MRACAMGTSGKPRREMIRRPMEPEWERGSGPGLPVQSLSSGDAGMESHLARRGESPLFRVEAPREGRLVHRARTAVGGAPPPAQADAPDHGP